MVVPVPPQIVDTVVLIAALNRNDPLYKRATEHVVNIGLRRDIFVPFSVLWTSRTSTPLFLHQRQAPLPAEL